MRKLILSLTLCFLTVFAVAQETKSYYQQKFLGENLKITPRLLGAEESPGMSNFKLEEVGAIKERDLFGKYNSTSGVLGNNYITGLFKLYTASGSKYFIACAGQNVAVGTAGAFSSDISPSTNTVTIGTYWSGAIFNNAEYMFNPSVPMKKYIGTGGLNTPASYPATNCSFCAVHKQRLWAARSDTAPYRLYYSSLSNADDWTSSSAGQIDLPDLTSEIKGIVSWGGYLWVFTETNIWCITGSTPNSFVLVKTSSDTGTIAPRSIQATDTGLLFLARTGVFSFNGTTSYKISDKVEPLINSISKSNIGNVCALWDGQSKYWLSYPDSSSSYNNKILCYDTSLKEWYPYDNLNISYFLRAFGGTDKGELYGGSAISNGIVWQLQATSGTESITHSSYTDFTDGVTQNTTITQVPSVELEKGYDTYVKFLSHGDGVDGSTTIIDETGKTVTATGAVLDSGQRKFGNASIYFDGASAATVPDSNDWDFGTGDFTVDFWLRLNAAIVGTPQTFIDRNNGGDWRVSWDSSGNIKVTIESTDIITQAWTPSINAWYHIAAVRSGTGVYLFINGSQYGSTGTSADNIQGTDRIVLGRNEPATTFMTGWLDEVRVSKGIARWTSSFTPSSEPYRVFADDGTFTSRNIQINASGSASLGGISWVADYPTNTRISFQTRTGVTNDSVYFNGWQYWSSTNSVTLSTVTDATAIFTSSANNGTFTIKKPFPAQIRNILYYEDEDSQSVNSVSINTVGAASTNKYIEGWISPTNLSGYDWLGGWVKSPATGNSVEVYFGEGKTSDNCITINTVNINQWQKWFSYIGGMSAADKDNITYIKYRYMGDVAGGLSFGELSAFNFYETSDVMSSNPNDWIQYRSILASNNIATTPKLYTITLTYTPGLTESEDSLLSYYYTKPIDAGSPMKNKQWLEAYMECKFDTTSSTVTLDYIIDDGVKTGTLTFPYTCVTNSTVRMKKNFSSSTFGKTIQLKINNSNKDSQTTVRAVELRYKEESLND